MKPISDLSDLDLLAQLKAGERNAFAELVRRHQSLVCAQAYAVCGDFGLSEDVAQEAFIASWRQLGELQDGSKFKSWICTIARRLALRVAEKGRRAADSVAAPLEAAAHPHDPAPSPHAAAVSREESALVWSALDGIAPEYREPLVLFYREGQSVPAVAAALEISEDAAKQRLARGRAMLRDQLAGVVEGVLARTRPGTAFTIAVLAAVPGFALTSASAATVAGAAPGSAVAKGAIAAGVWAGTLGCLSGLLGAALGTYASVQTATYERERRQIWQYSLVMLSCIALFGASLLALPRLKSFAATHPSAYSALLVGWMLSFMVVLGLFSFCMNRRIRRTYAEEKAAGAVELPATRSRRFFAGWQGLQWQSAASFLGLALVDIRFAPAGSVPAHKITPARGWIAIGNRAHGLLLAVGNIAIGSIAVGGVSVGLLSFGGLAAGGIVLGGASLGVVALGGASIGILAFGGLAIGWWALGGAAVAWRAAVGGAAWAHDYAVGGTASATHANDAAARLFVRDSAFFQSAEGLVAFLQAHQPAIMVSSVIISVGMPLLILALAYQQKEHRGSAN